MKARIFASLIITTITGVLTGVLAFSLAQADSVNTIQALSANIVHADSANTVDDINDSYLNPSWTRNADVSNYMTFIQEKQDAQKVVLVSITSKYNLDPLGGVYSN